MSLKRIREIIRRSNNLKEATADQPITFSATDIQRFKKLDNEDQKLIWDTLEKYNADRQEVNGHVDQFLKNAGVSLHGYGEGEKDAITGDDTFQQECSAIENEQQIKDFFYKAWRILTNDFRSQSKFRFTDVKVRNANSCYIYFEHVLDDEYKSGQGNFHFWLKKGNKGCKVYQIEFAWLKNSSSNAATVSDYLDKLEKETNRSFDRTNFIVKF